MFLLPFLKPRPALKFILIFAILITLTAWQSASAQCCGAQPSTFTQPDGTVIEVHFHGNEKYTRTTSADGYTLIFDPNAKAYFYAELSPAGDLFLSTGKLARQNKPADLAVAKNLELKPEARRKLANQRAAELDAVRQDTARWEAVKAANRNYRSFKNEVKKQEKAGKKGFVIPLGTVFPDSVIPPAPQMASGDGTVTGDPPIEQAPPNFTLTGDVVGLTILVDFSDAPGTVVTQTQVDDYFNKPSYTGFSQAGSVYDYFFIQSGGKLRYNNNVTYYVRVPQPKTYYNNTATDSGLCGRLLLNAALDVLIANGYDFSKLTTKAGGNIRACNVFFAGADSGVWAKGLWPHRWVLSPSKNVGGGKYVYDYQITNIGTTANLAIGTVCHENGHMLLGYPDLYSYDGNAANFGNYSLMASGNYGGGGKHPTNIDPCLKEASGWMDIVDLNSSSQQRCTVQVDGNQVYRYLNPAKATEYFMFEVRDNTGWEGPYGAQAGSVNPGTGLVAYHAYETGSNPNSSIITANSPNCSYTKPYELMVVEANQPTAVSPWYDDPTPDTSDAFKLSGKSALSDATTPDLKFWNPLATGGGRTVASLCNINSISADSNVMTFVAGAGALGATPGLVLSRSTINSYCNFGATAAPQSFTICNGQGGTLNYSIAVNQTWLSCTPTSGTATTESDIITINYTTSGLAAGSYSATITVNDPAASPSTKTITVTLTVTARPVITLSTATIAKTGITGTSGPQASFGVNNTGGGTMNYTVSATQPWLSLSPASGTVVAETDTIYANFNATSLAPGIYTDTITVTSADATITTRTIDVTFTVQGTDMIVTSPNGGEPWNKGDTRAITWVSGLGGNVKIELLKGGVLNSTLTASTANTGSFNWTISEALVAASDYTVQITSIESPTKTDTSNATFTILATLADALDTTGLTWTNSGNLPWFSQTTTTHDGVDAGQSGAIGDSQTSSMETTLTGPGTVTFWWKVSSESGWDFLELYLNGILQTGSNAKISGEVNWVQKTISIPTGAQTVKWTYTKDGSAATGSDAAWVDQVVWTPSASPEIAVEQPVGTNLTDGSASVNCGTSMLSTPAAAVTFTVKNTGASNLTGLVLSKSGTHSADFALGTLGSTTVAPGGSTTFAVTFTPGGAGARTAALQIASNDSDENPFDITLNGTGVTVGTLAVSPAGGLTSSGSYGGPFAPASLQYTLSNPGNSSINWTAAKTATWVSLSAASGTLAAGGSTLVTVTINSNANALNIGGYSDTVTFTNTTNSEGNTTRAASLTVNPFVATVALSNLSHTYTGTAKSATCTTTPAGLAHTMTYAGSANLPIDAGTYSVVATITEPNYSGSGSGTLTINKASQTITFGALTPALDNAAPFALTGTASSGLQVTYASSNPAVATVSGDQVTIVGVGSTIITASQAGDQDHLAAVDVPQTLTVVRANPLAVTGGPYKVLIGQSLSLNGSGFPSDGNTITSYAWDLNNDGNFTDASGATPTAIAFNDLMSTWGMIQGFNTIQLRITDSALKTSTVSTTVELVLSLSWDANGATAGQTNGGGAWLGAGLWWDGAANTNWAAGSNAVFGGLNTAGGAVTLASPTTVNSITFNQFTGTYTLGTAAQAITLTSGINKTSTSAAVTFVSPITLGGAQTWTNNSSGVLATPSGTNFIDNAGYQLTIDGTGVTTSGAINNAAVTITGSGALVKNGTGRFNIGGLNSGFTGTVTINGGSLQAYSDPGVLGNGNLTLNSGVFSFYWGTTYTRSLGTGASQVQIPGGESGFGGAGTSAPTVNLGGSVVWGALGEGTATGYFNPSKFVLGDPDTTNAGVVTFSSSINLNGVTRTIVAPKGLSAGGNVSTISGVVSSTGAAGLIKEGNGTLLLSTANTYTGNTTISGGNLRIGHNTAGSLNSGNYAGNISIASGGNLQIWSSAAQILSGTISGAGGLQKAYGGTLTLSGPNTYSGRTSFLPQTTAGFTANIASFNSVNGGTPLMASSSLGAPITIANGTIDIGNGATQANVNLNYSGPGETTDRVINFGFNGTASQTLTTSGSALLKFTSAMTGNSITTQSGKLILDGTGSGEITQTLPALPSGGLTKNGTGTWTLGGANSYTGPTAITAGKLFINGSQSSATGAVTVSANATLGGAGAIGGSTTIAVGGKLEFAISTDTASHNSLDVAALKDFIFSGASTLTITSSGGAFPGTYTLVTGGNSITYTTLPTLILPNGWTGNVAISGNSLQLNVTSITGIQVALTYDANGASAGSVPVDSNSPYGSGTTVTVLGNTGGLVKTGYSFTGWNTVANGSGTAYAPATQFTINANTTLYAQWAPNSYSVTFNANGGSTPTPTSKSVIYDSTYGTLATTTRTGYTFNGWFTASSGGTLVTSATAVAITANQTLFAQWTVNTYTVTFDANGGGTPSPTSKSVTYGATYGALATITRAGYTFNGWFTAITGGTEVTAATTVAITAAQTLYAQWTANTYTVNFDANGGDAPVPTSKSVTYDAAYGTLATTARTGYSFNGWFTATSGGTQVTSATIVAITVTQTLYAQWTADTYTVTFDANGGNAPSPTSKSVTYGSAYGTLATTSRSGHSFNGWFTAITGGTQVISTTPVAITADQTLYAQWTPLAPEIAVSRGATPVADGGYNQVFNTTASTGTVLTFDIANSGASNLTLSNTIKSDESNCAVVISPPTSPVTPSASTNLVVTVTPAASGAWSFNLSITTNDADENPYNWTVHGVTGGSTTTSIIATDDCYIALNEPTIVHDGTSIALNSNTQQSHTRQGLVYFNTSGIPQNATLSSATVNFFSAGSGQTGTVDIYDTGDVPPRSWAGNAATWNNSSAYIGSNNYGGAISTSTSTLGTAIPTITLDANGQALVQGWVTNQANNTGLSIKTSYSSNKAANSVLLCSATHGTSGYRPKLNLTYAVGVSEMRVARADAIVADAGIDTVTGTVATVGTQLTYRIANLGNANLTLPSLASASAVSNCSIVINTQPTSPVIASADTPLLVTVTPTAAGTWSATVSIASNDSDENPYNWTISGTTANAYAVTFDRQGGTGGDNGVAATFGLAMPTATAPTRTGYTFGGYYASAGGTGTQYYTAAMASATNWDVSANATIYANWIANSYTVSFDKQGGTGGSVNVSATFGSTMPTATAPTRTGYTFDGFHTAINGGGTQYYTAAMASAANWGIASNTILYAKWIANTYAITFDTQGGTGGSASASAAFESAMPTATAPTLTGYTFGGYYTAINGGGTQYYTDTMASARNWDLLAATTLYAKWTATSYDVIFDKQGGTGGSASVLATYGIAMPAATAPARAGYTFGGYYTAINGGGIQYYNAAMASAANWNITTNTTLYANWTANSYTVTFDMQGGTGGSASVLAAYGSAMPTATAPTRSGYTFAGYYPSINGGGFQYYTPAMASAANWDIAANATLYANWTANNYTVTFDTQSGTGGDTSVSVTYGSAMPTATAPTRTDYTFSGYFSAINGGGTQYYDAAMTSTNNWNIAATTTLYAKWTANSFTITFDSAGGTAVAPITQANGTAVTAPANPTKSGYTFAGWSPTVPATMPAADTTCIAQWTVNSYTITFNSVGGSTVTAITQNFGTTVTAPAAPTKTGYTFTSWSPMVPATMPAADTTCVAQWTVINYTSWASGTFTNGTLGNQDMTFDFDGDGLASGVEWVIGTDPTLASDASDKKPVFDNTTDPEYFLYRYRRTDVANADPKTSIAVEYGNDLNGWTTAVHDGTNLIITPTNDFHGAGVDQVEVKIKRSTLAPGGKIFSRLKVVIEP